MKNAKFLLLSLLLFPSVANAAISAGAVIEIRSAGGADNGCYWDGAVAVPGTDYTQQDAAQDSGTDLVIDGADNTIVTSATHNFVAADEGNSIRVSAGTGFTTGWYTITDTSSNAATLDRAVGTVGSTGGTWAMGGACTFVDAVFEAATAGNKFWVKADGTYTLTAAVSVANDGTSSAPIVIDGYNATRGDAPTGDNMPDIAAGANITTWDNYWITRYLDVTTTESDGWHLDTGGKYVGMTVYNSSGTANRGALTSASASTQLIYNNDLRSDNGECFNNASGSGGATVLIRNVCHDSNIGYQDGSGSPGWVRALFNIFDTLTTYGSIYYDDNQAHSIYYHNTFYNMPECIHDNNGSGLENIAIIGNIFHSCSTSAIDFSGSSGENIYLDENVYYNNGTDVVNVTKGPNATTGIDPGFTDAAGGDFSISTTLKGISHGQFGETASTGYLDPGAVQRQEAGGGASSFTFIGG